MSKSQHITFRLSAGELQKVDEAAAKMGLSRAEVIRQALGVGMETLRRLDFDIFGTIVDRGAESPPSRKYTLEELPSPKVAEDEGKASG
jgi:hypothetical protein